MTENSSINDKLNTISVRTFIDIVDSWCGLIGNSSNIRRMDNHIQLNLPSFLEEIPPILSNWIISAQKKTEKTKIKHNNYDLECWIIKLNEPEIETIKDLNKLDKNNRSYLAIAINHDNTDNLLDLSPTERYEWFAIDLKQYINEYPSWERSCHILIPTCNNVNLASFSLLWSSQWVEDFFSPLFSPEVFKRPDIHQEILRIFNSFHGINKEIINKQKEFITGNLNSLKSSIGLDKFKKILFRTSLGVAFNEVNHIMQSTGDIGTIINYCPESLYGTVNLWLFSRLYHTYMDISAKAAETPHNIRLLPLDITSTNQHPRIMKAAIWNVLRYYTNLKVDVKIISSPKTSDNPGQDRNFYGNGIGHFPWLTISDDGCTLEYHTSLKGDISDNQDFLNFYMKDPIIESTTLTNSLATLKKINIGVNNSMELGFRKPIMFFPAEDNLFLQHPNNLWII